MSFVSGMHCSTCGSFEHHTPDQDDTYLCVKFLVEENQRLKEKFTRLEDRIDEIVRINTLDDYSKGFR